MGSRLGPIALLAASWVGSPAVAADWVEATKLTQEELRAMCDRASDVKLLVRMQMLTSTDAEWRQLSRRALTIEGFSMGVAPLDPTKCYVVAQAGRNADPKEHKKRRAFEVRDFTHSPERTLIMVVGRQAEF